MNVEQKKLLNWLHVLLQRLEIKILKFFDFYITFYEFFKKRFIMSIIDHREERLIHTMIFFIKNTKYCHKLKLFKLLYFLDFEVFRQTGRSVTDLKYFAWKMGPVPTALLEMIDYKSKELQKAFDIQVDSSDLNRVTFHPKISFNKGLFTIREQEVMKTIAFKFKDKLSDYMIKEVHKEGTAWHKIYVIENKKQNLIPYLPYALDDKPDTISIEQAKEIETEDEEIRLNFG